MGWRSRRSPTQPFNSAGPSGRKHQRLRLVFRAPPRQPFGLKHGSRKHRDCNGLVSQLDLLDAQRSELRSRRQAVQVRSAQYQATVGLIRALGGGWEAAGG